IALSETRRRSPPLCFVCRLCARPRILWRRTNQAIEKILEHQLPQVVDQ
ncbi:unnamed protein product, partial [Musa acuminata subsp. burmannicoides]